MILKKKEVPGAGEQIIFSPCPHPGAKQQSSIILQHFGLSLQCFFRL